MASLSQQVELLEIDEELGDNMCSDEESGVFVNSVSDGFSAFQQWSTDQSPIMDTSSSSSPPPIISHCVQQVPNGHDAAITAAGAPMSGTDDEADPWGSRAAAPRPSIVDCLLVELYDVYSGGGGARRSVDSLDSSTEASSSDAFLGRSNTGSGFLQELQEKHTRRHQMNYLAKKDPEELRSIIQEVKYRTGLQSAKLLRQLRRRDRLHHKLQKNYDIITACLQAVSQKRRVDTRLKFTIEPSVGKNGFQQWNDALKAVARLATGVPKEWRKRVWLTLADQYLHSISIDWEKTLRFAFNERSNPDDDSLGIQIVKDLHRTGCSSYCGQEGEQDRVVLKRVLLAYARWNKTVGYCQGFNVLAALILEVTEGSESDALKVMIYLIDKVLPESYFANNLQALSVDMAVFRDLLRLKLPRLSQHLHHLQKAANKEAGGNYEPPLTNVFTMQWFLTMFATCLPSSTVLKIWDSVFFEGSEVLLRVALAIWERLGERIEYCETADEFYSTMGCLAQEMLGHSIINPTELMQEVYSMAVFPFPQLAELREKYTYNITPFPTSVKSNGSGGLSSWESDDDADMDDEDAVVTALGCLGPLGGLLAPELQRYQKHLKDQRGEQGNMAELSPGAVGAGGGPGGVGGGRAEHQAAINSMMMERMSTDINALKKQYVRIKRRQQQQAMQLYIRTDKCPATSVLASQLNPSTPVVNHLLLGRKPRGAPRGCKPSGARPSPLPQTPASPARHRSHGSAAAGDAASPWRTHVRVQRRNLARARAHLGLDDSEEREDEEEEEGGGGEMEGAERREDGGGREERRSEEESDGEADEKTSESSVCPPPPPPDPVDDADVSEVKGIVGEVEEQLASLELAVAEAAVKANPDAQPRATPILTPSTPSTPTTPPLERHPEAKCEAPMPILPPPPPSRHRRESDCSGSGSVARLPPPPPLPHRCPSPLPESLLHHPPSPIPSSDPASNPKPHPPSSPSAANASSPWSPSTVSSTSPSPSSFRMTSSPSTPSLSSLPSSSCGPRVPLPSSPSTPSSLSSSSATKQAAAFSPFPSVKQPRKSAAARNLGLYGPTSRTPTVHFPQLNLNLNRSVTAATTRRR